VGEVIDDNQFDIFQWANWADANKKDLLIDLFIFNKNFTPYVLPLRTSTIEDQMRTLFLYDMINFVETGAAVGLSVRDYATNEQMENVLLYSELESIQRADTLIYLLGDDNIAEFNEKEHEMKRMHGTVARFSDPKDPDKTFYIAKQLQRSQMLSGSLTWQVSGSDFGELNADAAFKIPANNQVLIAGGKVFAFNPKKFVNLFRQDPSSGIAAKQIAKHLTEKFALSFPEGLSLGELADNSRSLTDTLLKLDVEHLPDQQRVIDHADEMNLALMTDNNDGIIIMDNRDAMMFVNILADNYVDSNLTGSHYLATSKKRIDGDSQMNMNI
jgi:hypothetical protein